jgi:hypothetical protein
MTKSKHKIKYFLINFIFLRYAFTAKSSTNPTSQKNGLVTHPYSLPRDFH